MSAPSFNLVDRPWIPAVDSNGAAVELGLEETLTRAHELRAVIHDSPLVTAVLHRLLLLVIHRSIDGPRNLDGWRKLHASGELPGSVSDYLRKWEARFDLFHPTQPFLQDPSMNEDESIKWLPASNLALELATGNNPTFFDHTDETRLEFLSHAEAIRQLLAHMAFAAGGRIPNERASWSQAPLRGAAIFVLRGSSLFETLLLNLLRYDSAADLPLPARAEDLPVWERPLPDEWAVTRAPTGWLDLLLFNSRRYLFRYDAMGVREVKVAGGHTLPEDARDPMCAFVERRDRVLPVAIRRGQALWRDSHALFRLAADDVFAPYAFSQIASLVRQGVLLDTATYAVDALGAASKQAKIFLWRHETLPVPVKLLDSPQRAQAVADLTTIADVGAQALRRGLGRLAETQLTKLSGPLGRRPAADDVRDLIEHTQGIPRYWAALGLEFPGYLTRLATDLEALESWVELVRSCAQDALRQACRAAERSRAGLKAATQAEATLNYGLRSLVTEASE